MRAAVGNAVPGHGCAHEAQARQDGRYSLPICKVADWW
jgi:hypothetical protein